MNFLPLDAGMWKPCISKLTCYKTKRMSTHPHYWRFLSCTTFLAQSTDDCMRRWCSIAINMRGPQAWWLDVSTRHNGEAVSIDWARSDAWACAGLQGQGREISAVLAWKSRIHQNGSKVWSDSRAICRNRFRRCSHYASGCKWHQADTSSGSKSCWER